MSPTPSTAQKKALGELLLLSYYTTQKKNSEPKYFLVNVQSWVFKCLSKIACCAPTSRTDTGMSMVGSLSTLTTLLN